MVYRPHRVKVLDFIAKVHEAKKIYNQRQEDEEIIIERKIAEEIDRGSTFSLFR
jgi:hypothetical protein